MGKPERTCKKGKSLNNCVTGVSNGENIYSSIDFLQKSKLNTSGKQSGESTKLAPV